MAGPYTSGNPGDGRTMACGMHRAGPLILLLLLLPWTTVPAEADLAGHPSPYLRSHADDPVRWRSPETVAIGEESTGNVPFLVSSGYLSCYWCYRFKRDTLGDPHLARVINGSFVPVLLDREMHTQDDRALQAFMREFVGIGGWPATAVLTPEGVPIMAWSHVAAPELASALETFARAWEEDSGAVRRMLSPDRPETGDDAVTPDSVGAADLGALLQGFLDQTGQASDTRFGGFGTGSKYPFVPQLQTLLDLHQLNPSESMAAFLRHSLDSMIAGDLMDPVEGGVFRYTESRDWTEPHFEQMLYTQALVARLLFRASVALERPVYGAAAEGILQNMLARFTAGDGWFVSSLSATGEAGVNGAYYLATRRDLETRLGQAWRSRVEIRQQTGDRLLVAPVGPLAGVTRQALVSLRRQGTLERDDKRLLSWNGLALSALSYGAAGNADYLPPARRLAEAILQATVGPRPGLLAGVDPAVAPADLDALVLAAAGLFDWWQVADDTAAAVRVGQLLELAVERFFRQNRWSRAPTYLLPGTDRVLSIADDQLPSPSAEWLRLGDGLRAAGFPLGPRTGEVSALMARQWPPALAQSAFFHPTLVSALVTGRLLGIH